MNFRTVFFYIAASLSIFFSACSQNGIFPHSDENRITIMTYNTQTFFDAIEDGSEFAEFTGPKTKWSLPVYESRLNRLCEAILLCGQLSGMGSDRGPDIVVLQEIENDRVLHDVCNRLPRRGAYEWAAFVPGEKGNAFGSALLSRYPIESLTVHSLSSEETALRPLLQMQLKIGNESLALFAVHWKSKTGDNEGFSLRLEQEALLASRIETFNQTTPGIPFIVCGDFNQTRAEFTLLETVPNCWDEWLPRCLSGACAGPAGSYYYNGEWETIDNIFYSPSLSDGTDLDFSSFQVAAQPPLIDQEGIPARFDLFSGKGYSDHLPLILELKRK